MFKGRGKEERDSKREGERGRKNIKKEAKEVAKHG